MADEVVRHHGCVPFNPSPGCAVPDPRFDPYRERAGALSREGEPVGLLYLRFDTCWTQVGGHLWWRRWSEPKEQVSGCIVFSHGGFDDFVETTDTLVDELEQWGRGLFRTVASCSPSTGSTMQVHVEHISTPSISRRIRALALPGKSENR